LEDELNQVKWAQQKNKVEPFTPPYQPPTTTNPWVYPNDPTKPKPMWGPSWSSTDVDIKKWTAGDDPGYKGSTASMSSVDELLKELKGRL